ncbi:YigZ family protein [Flavobacterium sp. Fl-77]|uniref:YigZ family protein n=1 Tax=Flavobacterium flavipigmentatum TaxID=2893884 RepID=A0AAJ2SA22_9FLAO|nr:MULTISPECIES: YigZ family protein [unclassified Flavobacterium]MDX6183262.1 YigZ family protein [Flavobacterium sp. Fl-33]MDX6186546.1 YigZ family protein [Flavobacterium sp. Fl-77]UFH38684.1 YigZ family protein [Flavobacterium sp. F-70]
MEYTDTYQTIAAESEEVLFKEKGSKFFGYAFPIQSEDEVKPIIENLKKLHPHAVHFCYAYQLGVTPKISYRANDDGEPSNTAGAPIYGQIQSFGLTNVIVVVVRIFGGTKLGVGGLISAYKTSAQMTLENCEIVEKTIDVAFLISFDYKNMNKVMRLIKEKKLDITSQEMEMDQDSELPIGKISIKTRKKNAEMVFDIFSLMFEINIKYL